MADKKAPFTIGSSLDGIEAWQLEKDVGSGRLTCKIKEPCKHLLVMHMEKRQGKPVSIVEPFFLGKEALNALCSQLKKKLGSGGTCKDDRMEFQGECRETLKAVLQAQGFRFKG